MGQFWLPIVWSCLCGGNGNPVSSNANWRLSIFHGSAGRLTRSALRAAGWCLLSVWQTHPQLAGTWRKPPTSWQQTGDCLGKDGVPAWSAAGTSPSWPRIPRLVPHVWSTFSLLWSDCDVSVDKITSSF